MKCDLYATLWELYLRNPCSSGFHTFCSELGKDFPEDKPIYLLDSLDSKIPLAHILWGLRAVPKEYRKRAVELLQTFSRNCVEHILPRFNDWLASESFDGYNIMLQEIRDTHALVADDASFSDIVYASDIALDAALTSSDVAYWDACATYRKYADKKDFSEVHASDAGFNAAQEEQEWQRSQLRTLATLGTDFS